MITMEAAATEGLELPAIQKPRLNPITTDVMAASAGRKYDFRFIIVVSSGLISYRSQVAGAPTFPSVSTGENQPFDRSDRLAVFTTLQTVVLRFSSPSQDGCAIGIYQLQIAVGLGGTGGRQIVITSAAAPDVYTDLRCYGL
jgi:hypothetical protein